MYNKAAFLLIAGILFSLSMSAQVTTFPFSSGFRYQRGFIFLHKMDMDQLASNHVNAFELSYQKQTLGKKHWEIFYNYPQTGISVQYVDFNNALLGQVYALNPYISFPLKRMRQFEWHFRLTTGIGVFTRTFNLEDNRKNGAISSTLTGSIQFLTQALWRVHPRVELTAGLSFGHFSNGAWKVPNAGINFVNAGIGLNYHLSRLVPVSTQSFPIVPRGWSYSIWTGWFGKETDPVNSGKYLAGTLAFNALNRYSNKASWGLGLDLMPDWTLYKRRREGQPDFPLRGGLALLYELQMGKFSIPLQLGVYFYDRYHFDIPSYQRIGWRYRINKNLFLNCTLKAHLSRADYIEMGLGYTFRKH